MLKKSLSLNSLFEGLGAQPQFGATILFGFILILGAFLRFYGLGSESFWLDEVATTIEVRQSIPALLAAGRLDQPPAYYILLHFWAQIFGVSEVGLRSFSALAGTGSIILIYLVGRRLFGREVGMLGAFLMAISDFQILFSQEARNYSLFEFATLLSIYFFILFLGSKEKIHFILYIVFSIFMVYANAFGAFIIVAQNLFFVLQFKKYSNFFGVWFLGQTLIFLAILPYFSPIIIGDNGLEGAVASNISGGTETTSSVVIRSFYRFILPPRRYFGTDMQWDNSILGIYAVAGILLVAGVLAHAMRQRMSNWLTALRRVGDELLDVPDVKRNILLVSCWLLCPPILLFLILPVYDHRYVISAAPAFYLLLALGLMSIRKVVPLLISIGALMVLVAPGLMRYYTSDVREQWREVAAFIEENGGQNEVVVFAPNDSSVSIGNQQKAFNYYYRGGLPSCGIGTDELTDIEAREALMQCVSGHDSFWVIIRSPTPESRYKTFFLDADQTFMRLISEQQFVYINVYLFEMAK